MSGLDPYFFLAVFCLAGAQLGSASGIESQPRRTWAGSANLASCISAVPLHPPLRCDRLADPMELAVASSHWIGIVAMH